MSGRFHRLTDRSGRELLLVPASAVSRLDEEDARRLLERVCEESENEALLRGFAGDIDEAPDGRERMIEIVARMFAQGDVVAIAVDDERWLGQLPTEEHVVIDDEGDIPSLSDLLPDHARTTAKHSVFLEVLDYTGLAYAGQRVSLETADGRRSDVELDGAGRWSADDLVDASPVRLVLPAPLELTAAARRRPPLDGFAVRAGDLHATRIDPEPLLLAVDRKHRVIVGPPAAQPAHSFAMMLFAEGSACPTAAVADLVRFAQEAASADPSLRFGVFGHTDEKGSERDNKVLSDLRADVAYSLLTGDFATFRAVDEAEHWGLAELQAMLRAIGCNPGAIDGEPGTLTAAAIREFRRNYNEGFFHRPPSRPSAFGPLPDGDELDAATRDALLDAFHAYHATTLPQARFLGPGRSGCGEFNPRSDAKDNRRVSLAIYGAAAPDAGAFPCQRGDPGACEIDEGGRSRCRFYRERIGNDEVLEEISAFWDFEWLATPTGKAHLSALTSLPDANDAEIVIQMCARGEREDEEGVGPVPAVGVEIGRIQGLVRRGVIYGLWEPPDGFDPFRPEDWFRKPGDVEGEPWQPQFRPPVFAVSSAGRWGSGAAPGHRIDRIKIDDGAKGAVLFGNDGRIRLCTDAGELAQLGDLHVNGARSIRGG